MRRPSHRARALWLVSCLAAAGACGTHPTTRARVDAKTQAAVESPPERTAPAGGANQSTFAHSSAPDAGVAPVAAGDAAASAGGADADDGALVGEERERDPRSDTVKIKVIVAERRQAHVIWGRKDFGVAPLEIERPRDSGPLDLVVIAPGYLPYHARAFTDRDDMVTAHLYSAAEAPQLLGYRASEVPKPSTPTSTSAAGSTPGVNQNRQKSR